LLASGEVLIAGGFDSIGTLAGVERFNPATGLWTTTGSMIVAQTDVTDSTYLLLANGKVLVIDAGARSAESMILQPGPGRRPPG